MEKRKDFHNYDIAIERYLKKLKGEPIKYERNVKNCKALDYSKMPKANRDLLLEVHKLLVRKGNSKARQLAMLQRLSYVFLLFGKTSVKTASKEDFNKVADLIMQNNELNNTTKQIRIEALKTFDSIYFSKSKKEKYVKTVDIDHLKKGGNGILPEDIITPKEAWKSINSTKTIRDRALLSLLWSAGCRIGELGNMKVKNFQLTGKGNEAYVSLDGKTGRRRILLVEGVPEIRDWLEAHPLKNTPNFHEQKLFVMNNGEPMSHAAASKVVRVAMEKAGINKRKNCHSWRHARATFLCAKGMPEAQMRMYFGWSKKSDMPSVYAHLSGKNLEDSLRKALGIQAEHEEETLCKICNFSNDPGTENCGRCGNALTIEGTIKVLERNKVLEQQLDIVNKYNAKVLELVENGIPINAAKDRAIDVIAEERVLKTQKS